MENLMLKETALDQARDHVLFHHTQADGWITLAKKAKSGEWTQYHYRPEQLASKMAEWVGEDVYFSQNTFYKPQRRIENIRQLRALYVDVDCHLLNYDPNWVVGKLDLEIFQEALPNPNFIIFSGRGLVFIWLLEPVPYKALPLWKAMQNYFFEKLKYVGADKKSLDPTRVFRVAGTINSKSGNEVSIQYRHNYRYVLRDLQAEYLPILTPTKTKRVAHKAKVVRLHNIQNLHYARLRDLVKLVELREYNVKGHRELLCFLYRYWSCCLTDETEKSLEKMLEFNSSFTAPLAKHEVIRATKSAEKAWLAQNDIKTNESAISKGYPGAGYNLKNKTIIKWLGIGPEEQTHMITIIDANERRRRKRERDKMAYRDKKSSISRNKYIEQQHEKTEDKLWQLRKALERHPNATKAELARLLGIHRSHIYRLFKQI